MLRREGVRNFEQQRLRQQHALGVAADIVVGIADADRPGRRQQRRQRTDARAGLELARGLGPMIDDLAAELMAEHDVAAEVHRLAAGKPFAHLDHAMRVLLRMQVGAADAAGERLDQHLPRARRRFRQFAHDDLAVPENRSTHQRVSLYFGRPIARRSRSGHGSDHANCRGSNEVTGSAKTRRPRSEAGSGAPARDARCKGRCRR